MNRFILVCLFLLCFYMLLLNFGNTKAVTYEELKQYVNYTADMYSSNSYYQTLKNYFNNNTNFIVGLTNGTVPISNYNNVNIEFYSRGVTLELYNVTSWYSDSYSIRYNGVYRRCQYSGSWSYIGSETTSDYRSHALNYCFSTTSNNYNTLQAMNYTSERLEGNYQLPATYVGMQAIPQYSILTYDNYLTDYTSVNNSTTYYRMTDIYRSSLFMIGEVHPFDSYYYEIRLRNYKTQQVIGEVFASENPFNPYNTGALTLNLAHQLGVKSLYLNYNTQYELEITSYYGDGGSNLEVLKKYYIFIPTDSVVSGDTILSYGSGDYTIQDNSFQVIGAIDEQTGIFQGLYNDLFTLDSGDVADLYGVIVDKFPSRESGDILYVYNQLYGLFTDEPEDFVISWDNIPVNLTFLHGQTLVSGDIIQASSINFDEMCRENQTLGIIKFWLNTILSFSLYFLLMVEFYKCCLQMLGISTTIAEDMVDDEEVVVDSVRDTSTVNRQTGQITENPIVISHTKYKKR